MAMPRADHFDIGPQVEESVLSSLEVLKTIVSEEDKAFMTAKIAAVASDVRTKWEHARAQASECKNRKIAIKYIQAKDELEQLRKQLETLQSARSTPASKKAKPRRKIAAGTIPLGLSSIQRPSSLHYWTCRKNPTVLHDRVLIFSGFFHAWSRMLNVIANME
jgi:hypothetical protein